jgi:tetratricopeptide (TPR) repeat protein
VRIAGGGLGWFWDGLLIPEQVVFSAVAEAQKLAIKPVPEDPLNLLENYGVIPTESLVQAAKGLAAKSFLDDTQLRVKVELVRRWLVQFHPLRTEIVQLEKLEQESVDALSSAAVRLRQQGKLADALALYERALAINPNHFKTVVSLAEGYLEARNFDNALKYYERAFQVNPIRHKDELVQVLEDYGHWLITRKDFAKAKQQYQRILDIEPDRVSAQQRLDEIAAYQSDSVSTPQFQEAIPHTIPSIPEDRIRLPWRRQQIIGGSVAIAALAIAATVFGVYQFSTSCSPGEQKELGILCRKDPNRISSGERTLFPGIRNTDRDLGIRAFRGCLKSRSVCKKALSVYAVNR